MFTKVKDFMNRKDVKSTINSAVNGVVFALAIAGTSILIQAAAVVVVHAMDESKAEAEQEIVEESTEQEIA